ncbi:MAG: tetratricopeptide repeat protein [Hyphococcus sp.]
MKRFYLGAAAALLALTAPALAQTQDEADAMLAAEEWSDAAAAYRALLAADEENAQLWFSLASALHQMEDFDGAAAAYLAALEAGYPRVAQARFRLARVYAALGRDEDALAQLELLAESGGPSGQFVANTAEFAAYAQNPRFLAVVGALTPCTDEEYRHFDFWLGQWDVTGAGASAPTAKSSITAHHGGCAVLEQYEVNSGAYTGMSINFYDNVRDVWHQSWMANNGAPIYLEGGLNEDGAMVLSDEGLAISEASGSINRVTWTPNDDGSVRQFWEVSSDGGETWSTAFDGLYVRKEAGE